MVGKTREKIKKYLPIVVGVAAYASANIYNRLTLPQKTLHDVVGTVMLVNYFLNFYVPKQESL